MEIAELVEIDPFKGTGVEALAKFFEDIDWNVDFHADTAPRFADITEAEDYLIGKLDAGIPVMVDWVDWAGHWQVVIGLDSCGTDSPYDDVLILADPYDITDHCQDGYYIFPFGRFFRPGADTREDKGQDHHHHKHDGHDTDEELSLFWVHGSFPPQ